MQKARLSAGLFALLGWMLTGHGSVQAQTDAKQPLEQLVSADRVFARARAENDAEALVASLRKMVGLEGLVRGRAGQTVELTQTWQFEVSASLVKDQAALRKQLLSLVPYRRRGRDSESLNERFSVTEPVYTREEIFELDKPAIVYVRSNAPGQLHLTIQSAEDGREICSSFVETAWPVCYWTPRAETDARVLMVISSDAPALGTVQVLTN